MKSLSQYVLEYLNEAKTSVLTYTDEELKEIAKNYQNSESILMTGVEDKDMHAYIKPKNFKGKFFTEIDSKDANIMHLKYVIEGLAKACPELVVIIKTWEAIDTRSRINNLNREYYALKLPVTGMLFNSIKEAKQFIKENPSIKIVGIDAKKVKCIPMTCKDALEFIKEKESQSHRMSGPINNGISIF